MNGCETDTFDDQENNDTIQYSETEKKCLIARGLSDIIVYTARRSNLIKKVSCVKVEILVTYPLSARPCKAEKLLILQ